MTFCPRYVFLTKGVGRHKEKLNSFEEALRDAKIACFNLVSVSSILPPHCKLIPLKKGLEKLKSGQITYCVMSRNQSDENRRLIAAAIGLAIPNDPNRFGYISEHHSYGETDSRVGDYAEDLATQMLATVMGIDFNEHAVWDPKRNIWRVSKHIIRTTNITQSAICTRDVWTTVVAAAIFVP